MKGDPMAEKTKDRAKPDYYKRQAQSGRWNQVTINERRNLVAVSALAFAYAWFGWTVKSLNGGIVQIENIHPAEPYYVLIGLVTYFLAMTGYYALKDGIQMDREFDQRNFLDLEQAVQKDSELLSKTGSLMSSAERKKLQDQLKDRVERSVSREEKFNHVGLIFVEVGLPVALALSSLWYLGRGLVEARGG